NHLGTRVQKVSESQTPHLRLIGGRTEFSSGIYGQRCSTDRELPSRGHGVDLLVPSSLSRPISHILTLLSTVPRSDSVDRCRGTLVCHHLAQSRRRSGTV